VGTLDYTADLQPRFDLNQLHRRPEFAPAPQAIAAVAAPVEKLSTVVATDTVVKQLDTTPYNTKANIDKASEEDAFQDQFDGSIPSIRD
jgi:hypothetical protein